MDTVTKAKRSEIMSRVCGKGNFSTELRLGLLFARLRIKGWKRNVRALAGSPDFVFPVQRLAVFVHGCFWHGCSKCYSAPTTNRVFWRSKIVANKKRDARALRLLRKAGYSTIVVWECQLRQPLIKQTINRIKRAIAAAAAKRA